MSVQICNVINLLCNDLQTLPLFSLMVKPSSLPIILTNHNYLKLGSSCELKTILLWQKNVWLLSSAVILTKTQIPRTGTNLNFLVSHQLLKIYPEDLFMWNSSSTSNNWILFSRGCYFYLGCFGNSSMLKLATSHIESKAWRWKYT